MEVSPVVVDASQTKVMESLKALSDARSAMVTAHGELYKAQLRVGIRTRMLVMPGAPSLHFHDDVEEPAANERRRAV